VRALPPFRSSAFRRAIVVAPHRTLTHRPRALLFLLFAHFFCLLTIIFFLSFFAAYPSFSVFPRVRRYSDFVRLRNMLSSKPSTREAVGSISEYSDSREVRAMRAAFYEGEIALLLYSERFHYFRRYPIRGTRHLVFFGLPRRAENYNELISLLDDSSGGDDEEGAAPEPVSCTVLFTKYEADQLVRIVGVRRAKKMLRSEQQLFLLV